VEPGFLPWYPVAVAYAVGAGGTAAGLWVNPALAVLALAAVYLAWRAPLGAAPAALGTGLLAISLAQVWFARYTMAEPATQLLVWTGLYALAALQRRPGLALGLLAGLAWGSALLARVDAMLLAPAVALYLAWRLRTSATRASALLALAVLAVLALHAALHAGLLAPGYTGMVFSGATLAVAAGGLALTLAGAGALWALLVWWRPAHPRHRGVV